MQIDPLKRRELIALLGSVAMLSVSRPLTARAQQAGRVARIGYLGFWSASQHTSRADAFRAGLRNFGWVEGQNLHIEFRFGDEDNDRLPSLAAELVRLNVDVIVAHGTGVDAARRATTTIPIVMATYGDAVATGAVASLARPGGNVTGSTFFYPELMAKRLELLKEVVPSMTRVGVLLLRGNASNGPALEMMGMVAKALKVGLQPIEISRLTDLQGAFSMSADQQIDTLVVGDHPLLTGNADAIAILAAKHRLPSIGLLDLAANGGLMAYGVNFIDMFRRAATFVDKILKGAKPGDLPVERATKFVTIVNLKTAKALGIEVPTSPLLRADEVIE